MIRMPNRPRETASGTTNTKGRRLVVRKVISRTRSGTTRSQSSATLQSLGNRVLWKYQEPLATLSSKQKISSPMSSRRKNPPPNTSPSDEGSWLQTIYSLDIQVCCGSNSPLSTSIEVCGLTTVELLTSERRHAGTEALAFRCACSSSPS